MSSPCINVCRLDEHGVCVGCKRTIDEITQAGISRPNRSDVHSNHSHRVETLVITLDELDRDPWTSYPVDKAELRKLIEYRDLMQRYDGIDPWYVQVQTCKENADGSADIEFTIGRDAARAFIQKGFLATLTEMVEEQKRGG